MARSRESRTLEFEDEYLPEPDARAPRVRSMPARKSGNPERRRLLFAMIFLFFLIIIVAAVALAYQVNTFLATDPRFKLRQSTKDGLVMAGGPIEFIGAEHVPQRELLAVFERDIGGSLYLLPLAARREQLLGIDWIEDASISRLWPDRLRVVIKERKPVVQAAVSTGHKGEAHQMMMADSNGVLIRRPRQGQFDLPVMFGLSPDQTIEYRESKVKLAVELQTALAARGVRFSEIDVSDDANLRLSLTVEGKNVSLLLGSERYLERIWLFLDQAPMYLKIDPRANVFDMGQENRIGASREGLDGG